MAFDFENDPWFRRRKHEEKVWCPNCGAEYDLEEAYEQVRRNSKVES